MNPTELRRLRTQSVLKQLIPEALASLEDELLRGLCVTDVARYLQNFCAEAEGWYRCPAFHFKFDDRLEYQNKMDDLFDKIEEELRKNG